MCVIFVCAPFSVDALDVFLKTVIKMCVCV